jgi:transposase-like protein
MRLSDNQKQEIVTDFASGKSKSEIARKFKVSVTAISKILNNSEVRDKLSTKLNKFKSNKEYAKEIISTAYNSLLSKNFDKLSAETLLKIIERLSLLYNNSFDDNEEETISEVVVSFEDSSIEDITTENIES